MNKVAALFGFLFGVLFVFAFSWIDQWTDWKGSPYIHNVHYSVSSALFSRHADAILYHSYYGTWLLTTGILAILGGVLCAIVAIVKTGE